MGTFDHGHALIIGVGDYQNSAWSVQIARNEAQSVAEALSDPAGAAYPPAQVHTLFGAAATRTAILEALRQLAVRVDEDATVLLYLCGHGERATDGNYAFAAYDTVFTSDKRIEAQTGVSSQELLGLLRAIRARKLVCLVNACFAGNLGQRFGSFSPIPILGAPLDEDLGTQVLASGEGRVLLTAGRASQPSFYLFQQPHTFFGQALIEGLRGVGMPNNDGYISLYDLYSYIYERVTTAATRIDRVQEPMLTILQGVGPYPLALHPAVHQPDIDGVAPAIRQQTRSTHRFASIQQHIWPRQRWHPAPMLGLHTLNGPRIADTGYLGDAHPRLIFPHGERMECRVASTKPQVSGIPTPRSHVGKADDKRASARIRFFARLRNTPAGFGKAVRIVWSFLRMYAALSCL